MRVVGLRLAAEVARDGVVLLVVLSGHDAPPPLELPGGWRSPPCEIG